MKEGLGSVGKKWQMERRGKSGPIFQHEGGGICVVVPLVIFFFFKTIGNFTRLTVLSTNKDNAK